MTGDVLPKARIVEISPELAGQRIDNYLIKVLKGVPRTRIYKALRKGEVRVNGGRAKAPYHLKQGDKVRIPPIRYASSHSDINVPPKILEHIPVLYEDDHLLIVNKPSGLAVHGGSGMEFGLIEALRKLRSELVFVELVHRLDRETSGCLMLAKSRQCLLLLHEKLGLDRTINKFYTALVKGDWKQKEQIVQKALRKQRAENGQTRMVVDSNGRVAISIINLIEAFGDCSLMSIELKTGRMHQARVHCASLGYPIAGDRLYGDSEFNRTMKKRGLGRLFLHASRIHFDHPITGAALDVQAALGDQMENLLAGLHR